MCGLCRFYCAGLESTGSNGVIAGTGTCAGAGVYATDRTTDGTGFGLVSDGQVVVDGSLSVTDGCLGCGALILGRNATDLVIRRGDAVTLLGIDIAPDGSTIFAIGPAVGDDPVGAGGPRAAIHRQPRRRHDSGGAGVTGRPRRPR